MPYGGSYTARSPGELRTFSFDMAGDLARGDALVSAATPFLAAGDAMTLFYRTDLATWLKF